MSQLSSRNRIEESGPLSESAKVNRTEEARALAQLCHFLRSESVAEYFGGFKKSGVLGFGAEECEEEEDDDDEKG